MIYEIALRQKKGEGPQFTYFKDISFFKTAEGKQLDDLIEWVQDFIKRLNDADKNQIEKEKNSEIEELTNAGWLGKINPE